MIRGLFHCEKYLPPENILHSPHFLFTFLLT